MFVDRWPIAVAVAILVIVVLLIVLTKRFVDFVLDCIVHKTFVLKTTIRNNDTLSGWREVIFLHYNYLIIFSCHVCCVSNFFTKEHNSFDILI